MLPRSNSYRKWRMTAKTGHTRDEKKRQQTALKGRGCRVHKGKAPLRGKGRTAHGRRK